MRRVAIYYRVSTDRQDFDSQKFAIDHWLAINKPEVIYTYEDWAISGMKFHRPGLKKLLTAVRNRKIDAVVIYRLDRLSRSTIDILEIILKFDRFGVDLVCVKQNLFTTVDNPFRRTMLTLFAELAEVERGIMITRIKDGLAAARARGVRLGPPLKLTEEKIHKIKELRNKKKTYREISKAVGLSIGCVSKALR